MIKLPILTKFKDLVSPLYPHLRKMGRGYIVAAVVDLILIMAILLNGGAASAGRIITPLVASQVSLKPLTQTKSTHEVFGFAPYWNIDKMDNIDFKVLTTLAYFGIQVYGDGSMEKNDPGYQTFIGPKATELFKKAHSNGTRVVLTLTQMDAGQITQLMDDPDAQNQVINSTVDLVRKRGIDGINVDMEYSSDPGQDYRDKFTKFIARLTDKMHSELPKSSVSVSVYAASVKEPKLYDIAALGKLDIKVFMMAYDFAVAGSGNAIPTAPLNGHENGKYWYDVSFAVNDFLAQMPASKLILGVPYYGYNYPVYEPAVEAETMPYYSWGGQPVSQTYAQVLDNVKPGINGVAQVISGWDNDGKVGYMAYYQEYTGTWRMVFMEDSKSLGLKYDFAKSKDLAGVGVWALGNDNGKKELWNLLEDKFGAKGLAQNTDVQKRQVADIYE